MKLLRSFFLLLPFFLFTAPSFGQMIEDPTSWTYEAKAKGGNEYELTFHVTLKPDWHMWALVPGGDGYQTPTSFTFDNNASVKVKGNVVEKGKTITTTMDGVDGKVTYFTGKADFVQTVTVTGSTKITGKQHYQTCNNQMCLPPKEKEFTFYIKP